MDEKPVVNVTTHYSTIVSELTDAFSFVMSKLDSLGDDPSIEIEPFWTVTISDDDRQISTRRFSVSVSAQSEEGGA